MHKDYISALIESTRDRKLKVNSRRKYSAKDAFLHTEKELRRLNEIVRKKKVLNEHIGNTVFNVLRGEIEESRLHQFAADHFTAGYYSFIEIRKLLTKEKCFDYRGIKKYGYLITMLLYDLLPFANYIGQKKEADYYLFKGGKSNAEDSIWHFHGTRQLFYNCTFKANVLDNKYALILSAVSLRQTLELKMQRILGLADFYDSKGQKVFTKHQFFFEFILKNKAHIELQNVNIKVLQKIFEFCNTAVHKGIMPFIWQMFYAFTFCEPLFYDSNRGNARSWHIHSAVKIKNYNSLKSQLEKNIKTEFSSPEYDIQFIWMKPEAVILS